MNQDHSTGAKKSRLFIVDDHPLVRQGLRQLLELEGDLEVCGEADEPIAAIRGIAAERPDLAIVDISLQCGVEGLELIKDIRSRVPDVPVLVVSMHDEFVLAERALRAGAKGYVMKEEAMETVMTAVRKVLRGEYYISDNVGKKLLAGLIHGQMMMENYPMDQLTDRELEVFHLIGQGLGTSQIADKLHLSVKTVETHRAHIKEKLKLEDANRLLQYAIQWVHTDAASSVNGSGPWQGGAGRP
ncbi:MAG: response regulator transcription factor [Phycisphaerae bacterium]|nr:response regulator transcription factor [Phycisphaerae bacterium]